MEHLDNYKLSTWNSLWKYIGIPAHSKYGYYYINAAFKAEDIRDWLLNMIGMSKIRPPLYGESREDYYIRKVYGSSLDCFHRPIKGPAATIIKVCLRNEKYVENTKQLVIKPGNYKEAINFGSYNYLGFGGYHEKVTPQIIETLKNSGSCMNGFAKEIGISNEQKNLEKMLAKFLHKEDCVVSSMGFTTNSTLIPILISKDDLILSDSLNHSSLIVGMKSSKAEIRIFKHNDINDLKSKLEDVKKNGLKNGKQPSKVLVIIEGLYSMEGEFCKLKEIILLKKAYGFYLYIDEAHSIGCLGKTGRGIVEQLDCSFDDVDLLMGTFSKSFASAGGYIASDKKTISLLRNNSYSYVYGNPMSPVAAQQIVSCLEIINSPEGRRKIAQLRKNSISLRTKFIDAGCHVLGDLESPVIPVMVYHPAKLKDISRICLKNGVAIVVVGYPACPIDACRIRFCISAGHTDEDIEKGFQVTLDALKQTDCIFQNTQQPSSVSHSQKINLEELENLPKNPREMIPLYEDSEKKYKDINCELPEKVSDSQLNICNYDIHNFENSEQRKEKLIKIIEEYGCGSCGPRNFYGGTLEHVGLEEEIKKIYNTNEAIVISYGHNLMSSVIPVYAKPGNVVLVDEFCNYPIQLGCRLGKAKVLKFKHNDINDLSIKLEEAKKLISSSYSLISIVTEGIFQHDYSLSPLKEIVNLKKNFLSKNKNLNLFIILDDSIGIGTIGPNLKGSIEYAGLNLKDEVDILCGSFEFCLNSVGGFLAGSITKIYKCRLFAAGYIFSASSPPYSCTAAKDSFEQLEKKGKQMKEQIDKVRKEFYSMIKEVLDKVEVVGDPLSSCILLKCKDKNIDEFIEILKRNGFYVAKQQHLKEDWCQNDFIKVNLGTWFTTEKIKLFIDVIKNIN
jgi:serine palmitoyltransferase